MFQNKEVSKEISQLMIDFRVKLANSVDYVQLNCSEDEAVKYKEAIAKILGYSIFYVIEPIFEKHPDLRPDDLL